MYAAKFKTIDGFSLAMMPLHEICALVNDDMKLSVMISAERDALSPKSTKQKAESLVEYYTRRLETLQQTLERKQKELDVDGKEMALKQKEQEVLERNRALDNFADLGFAESVVRVKQLKNARHFWQKANEELLDACQQLEKIRESLAITAVALKDATKAARKSG